MKKEEERALAKLTDRVLAYSPTEGIPKAICEGVLKLRDIELPCAVLEGQARVFSQRKLLIALGYSGKQKRKIDDAYQLPDFLQAENLKPYISKDLMMPTNIIAFQSSKGGKMAYGLKAEALPMICEVFINAKDDKALYKNQLRIAKRCNLLQNGFARVGVIALVDEATGYQDIRAKRALAEILERFLAKEMQPWSKTFPLEFYRQIYRLRGWKWPGIGNDKKPYTPDIIGKYTDNFVYRRLVPGVLQELRERNPDRRHRHHQWFNPEQGHPKLREHISGVIVVMKLSDTWKEFKEQMDKVFPIEWTEGDLFYLPSRKN